MQIQTKPQEDTTAVPKQNFRTPQGHNMKPAQGTPQFYAMLQANAIIYQEQVMPTLTQLEHDETNYIKGLLQKLLTGQLLTPNEMKSFDLTPSGISGALGVHVSDALKYCTGLNFAGFKKSKQACSSFWFWYVHELCHTVESWLIINQPATRALIDYKIVNVWKTLRARRLVKKLWLCEEQKNEDEDEDDTVLKPHDFKEKILAIKRAFRNFTNESLLQEGYDYEVASNLFFQLSDTKQILQGYYITKVVHNELRQAFNARRNAQKKGPNILCKEKIKAYQSTLLQDTITLQKSGIPDLFSDHVHTLYERAQYVEYPIHRETQDFIDWQKEQNLQKLNLETDYDSTDEHIKKNKVFLLEELGQAIDYFVKEEPMILVKNIFMENISTEILTPKSFKMDDGHVPNFFAETSRYFPLRDW